MSAAVGNHAGLMPEFSTPHKVPAVAIDITVLKAPDEVERVLPRNDRPQTLLRQNPGDELPSHFGGSHITERVRLTLAPVNPKRFQVPVLPRTTGRNVVLETDLARFCCASDLKRTDDSDSGLHIVDLIQRDAKRQTYSLLIAEHLLQCRCEDRHRFDLSGEGIALLPHRSYRLYNAFIAVVECLAAEP